MGWKLCEFLTGIIPHFSWKIEDVWQAIPKSTCVSVICGHKTADEQRDEYQQEYGIIQMLALNLGEISFTQIRRRRIFYGLCRHFLFFE